MYQTFSHKIAVNLITGALGAGKTTLLRNFLRQKPKNEKWAVLVNEFGSIGIDGAILNQTTGVTVEQIPGGCICCTAKSELNNTVQTLLNTQQFDRLLIEPTGLGEPDALIDILQSDLFAERFNIQSIFAVFDSTTTTVDEFNQYSVLQNLANIADIILFNKTDLITAHQKTPLIQYAQNLYPPKKKILNTHNAQCDISLLDLTHNLQPQALKNKNTPFPLSETNSSGHALPSHEQTDKLSKTELPYPPINLPQLIMRDYHQALETQSIGWIFEPNLIFNWAKLSELFNAFNEQPGLLNIKRAKGVFRVGNLWMLFQWANGQSSREYIAYRRDSRLEILISANTPFDFTLLEQEIFKACKLG